MRPLLFLLSMFFLNHAHSMAHHVDTEQGIQQAINHYGSKVEPELKHFFNQAHVSYPPSDIALLAFKKERHVELWARNPNRTWKYVHTYPFTATSGRLGPKLKEHDRQIPEGVYQLTAFNPYSAMHLSMMINYPNHFDRLQASRDGRTRLGGNIFIHGKSLSVGCLAVGDKAIDQLFFLTHAVGLNHVQLIIAPNDLRHSKPATNPFTQPRWLPELYEHIQQALNPFSLQSIRI